VSVPAAPASWRAGTPVLVGVALAAVAACAVLAWQEDLGMRVACALAGAKLIALGLQGAVPL